MGAFERLPRFNKGEASVVSSTTEAQRSTGDGNEENSAIEQDERQPSEIEEVPNVAEEAPRDGIRHVSGGLASIFRDPRVSEAILTGHIAAAVIGQRGDPRGNPAAFASEVRRLVEVARGATGPEDIRDPVLRGTVTRRWFSAPNPTAPRPDTITFLTHETASATKRWFRAKQHLDCEAYGDGRWFSHASRQVTSIRDLFEVLEVVTQQSRTFAIRGELIRGRDPERVRRAKNPKDGDPPFFEERPRSWLMLDVDGINVGKAWDPRNPEPAARAVINALPSYFQNVTCIVQLSASAGIKDGFRGHLWFYLDHPVGERSLTKWANGLNDRAAKRLLDPTVFRTVQPLYTAAPLFEDGIEDPCAGRRLLLLEGKRDVVAFPVEIGGKTRDWRECIARLKDPANEQIHDHIRDACGRYFCVNGADADDRILREALTEAVAVALELQGRSDYGETQIEAEITSGRDYAKRMGAVGGDLQLDTRGKPIANAHNLGCLLSTPEWADVLAYNERSLRCVLLKDAPYGGPPAPRDLEDEDGERCAKWLNRVYGCPAHNGNAYMSMITLCKDQRYDRVREYLEGLPAWDGTPRAGMFVVTYCGAEDTPYARRVGEILLISSVARALQPGCDVDTMVILEGDQGVFKSKSLKALYGEDFYREGLPVDDKDMHQAMHGPWVIEIGEVDQYFRTRRDDKALKNFITQAKDDFRPPYGRSQQTFRRRCVLIGTTNAQSYLTDVTGARRYLPVKIARMKRDGILRDRDQIWAEAKALFERGVTWWYDAQDPVFRTEQAARRTADPWEETIREALEKGAGRTGFGVGADTAPKIEANAERVTAAQIWEHALDIRAGSATPQQMIRLGDVLRVLGWSRHRGDAGYFYSRG